MGSLLRRALILADVYKIFVAIVILLPRGEAGLSWVDDVLDLIENTRELHTAPTRRH